MSSKDFSNQSHLFFKWPFAFKECDLEFDWHCFSKGNVFKMLGQAMRSETTKSKPPSHCYNSIKL